MVRVCGVVIIVFCVHEWTGGSVGSILAWCKFFLSFTATQEG